MEESKLSKRVIIGNDLAKCEGTLRTPSSDAEAKSQDVSSETPVRKSIFRGMSWNQVIEEGLKLPDPIPLYGSLWFEGELCCLFADSNVGKTILAVQIGEHIAEQREEPVLYFDFELSIKMCQLRLCDKETGEIHKFPDNFMRFDVDPDALLGENFENAIIEGIEEVVSAHKAKIVIIDNISVLERKSEQRDCAVILMLRLKALSAKYDLSILILAHTPKRDLSRPINQNDLGGSKMLFDFFRSAFVIAKSHKDEGLVYVKQVKVTSVLDGLQYYYNNGKVALCEFKKVSGMLRLVKIEDAMEKDHLRSTEKITDDVVAKAKELQSQGKTLDEIAEELNVNRSTIYSKIRKK